MKALAARSIPIPSALDIYFLDSEYPARDDITALQAVMESNDEISHLEEKANKLNLAMAEADEPITQAYLDEGRWDVDIAGRLYPAVVSLKPLYDPEAKRVKA